MYVPSPYRGTIGLTTVSLPVLQYARSQGFPSVSAAMLALQDESLYTSQGNMTTAQTHKVILARGRVGRTKVPTNYATKYYQAASKGRLWSVEKQGVLNSWKPFAQSAWIGGVAGTGNVVNSVAREVDPNGTANSWEAIANRVAVRNLQNRVQTQLVEKSLNEKMNLAESLATLPQTLEMIGKLCFRVLNTYEALKRRNFTQALKSLGLPTSGGRVRTLPKDSARAWLELQYGWLPLLSDIYEGAKLIESELKKPGFHFTVTRRGQTGLLVRKPPISSSTWPLSWSIDTSGEAKVEAKMRCRIDNPNIALLSGLGLLNPLSLAWNLLPFSFVIDWFAPVGTMLKAFGAPLGLTFLNGYMSTVCYGRMTAVATPPGGSPPTRYFGGSSATEEQFGCMDRVPYSTWPALLPYISFPISSEQRAASASSLLLLDSLRRSR